MSTLTINSGRMKRRDPCQVCFIGGDRTLCIGGDYYTSPSGYKVRRMLFQTSANLARKQIEVAFLGEGDLGPLHGKKCKLNIN